MPPYMLFDSFCELNFDKIVKAPNAAAHSVCVCVAIFASNDEAIHLQGIISPYIFITRSYQVVSLFQTNITSTITVRMWSLFVLPNIGGKKTM